MLAFVGYVVIMVTLVTLMMAATFGRSDGSGELCAVIVALWVLLGGFVVWCTCARGREKRRGLSVPPTYSDSEEAAGERGRARGAEETDALLGPVSARAGGAMPLGRPDSSELEQVSLASPLPPEQPLSPAPAYDGM
jgi:hypothetical protein